MAELLEKVDLNAATIEQLRDCGFGDEKAQVLFDAITERCARQTPRPFTTWPSVRDACGKGVGDGKVLCLFMPVTHQICKFSAA